MKLAEKYDFYILEDDGLSNLYFGQKKPVSLKSMDTNQRVIYIKSYSKIFMPGLRLAYTAVPDKFVYSIRNKNFLPISAILPLIRELSNTFWKTGTGIFIWKKPEICLKKSRK